MATATARSSSGLRDGPAVAGRSRCLSLLLQQQNHRPALNRHGRTEPELVISLFGQGVIA